jgi:hypothetical protein
MEKHIDSVHHPTHYGGADNPYEAIKVIEAWELNFCLGNAVKYISRAGKKDRSKTAEDLEKAIWYLNRELNKTKKSEDLQSAFCYLNRELNKTNEDENKSS